MAALIAQEGSKVLSRCKLLIIDEFQMMARKDRGPKLEFIVTKILNQNLEAFEQRTSLMGISAVLSKGGNDSLRNWLRNTTNQDQPFTIVESLTRPVDLIETVISPSGYSISKSVTSGEIKHGKVENLPKPASNLKYPNDLLSRIVGLVSKQGRKTLVFRATRNRTKATANSLTRVHKKRRLSESVIGGIDGLESTSFLNEIKNYLPRGTAYHNASLSYLERRFVEGLFGAQDSPLQTLSCTETLAAGVNLPADVVIVADLDRPDGSGSYRMISLGDYKNMVGRAGRYGFLDENGEQIKGASYIFAQDDYEAERIFEVYIKPNDAGFVMSSAVGDADLQHQILSIISSMPSSSIEGAEIDDATKFIRSSLYAQEHSKFARDVSDAWAALAAKRLISEGKLSGFDCTDLGSVLARTGISVGCYKVLKQLKDELLSWDETRFPLTLLFLVCLSPEVRGLQWPRLDRNEQGTWVIVKRMQSLIDTNPIRSGSLLEFYLSQDTLPGNEILKAIKRTYLLFGWYQGESIRGLSRNWGGLIPHSASPKPANPAPT